MAPETKARRLSQKKTTAKCALSYYYIQPRLIQRTKSKSTPGEVDWTQTEKTNQREHTFQPIGLHSTAQHSIALRCIAQANIVLGKSLVPSINTHNAHRQRLVYRNLSVSNVTQDDFIGIRVKIMFIHSYTRIYIDIYIYIIYLYEISLSFSAYSKG